eukprot:ctg_728.g356
MTTARHACGRCRRWAGGVGGGAALVATDGGAAAADASRRQMDRGHRRGRGAAVGAVAGQRGAERCARREFARPHTVAAGGAGAPRTPPLATAMGLGGGVCGRGHPSVAPPAHRAFPRSVLRARHRRRAATRAGRLQCVSGGGSALSLPRGAFHAERGRSASVGRPDGLFGRLATAALPGVLAAGVAVRRLRTA